ncbi:hypothetical protein ACFORO_10160 [Amycolatopsis halotolerans]|uniref:Uncharacterized protein n=1 Tax=Amycolatopsis halotolerans TaxID=330083 RepID=A0ABV7QB08_9PSEU
MRKLVSGRAVLGGAVGAVLAAGLVFVAPGTAAPDPPSACHGTSLGLHGGVYEVSVTVDKTTHNSCKPVRAAIHCRGPLFTSYWERGKKVGKGKTSYAQCGYSDAYISYGYESYYSSKWHYAKVG